MQGSFSLNVPDSQVQSWEAQRSFLFAFLRQTTQFKFDCPKPRLPVRCQWFFELQIDFIAIAEPAFRRV